MAEDKVPIFACCSLSLYFEDETPSPVVIPPGQNTSIKACASSLEFDGPIIIKPLSAVMLSVEPVEKVYHKVKICDVRPQSGGQCSSGFPLDLQFIWTREGQSPGHSFSSGKHEMKVYADSIAVPNGTTLKHQDGVTILTAPMGSVETVIVLSEF